MSLGGAVIDDRFRGLHDLHDLHDPVLIDEIRLVADLMVAASTAPGPLTQTQVDTILRAADDDDR